MLSEILSNFEKIKKDDIDKEVLRSGIAAELEIINLFEQMSALTENETIKKILSDVITEEKRHMAKFHALLLHEYKEMEKELEEGKKRLEEIFSAYRAGAKGAEEQKETNPVRKSGALDKTSLSEKGSGLDSSLPQEAGLSKGVKPSPQPPKAVKPSHHPPKTEKPSRQPPKAEKPSSLPPIGGNDTIKSERDSGTGEMYMCPVCGHKLKDSVPQRCPICGAPGERFRKA